ncbi:hypothetical protein Tco_0960056 [Tanacetum coccineum]
MSDSESDDIIQRKELNKKATKKATVKKNQADKKNKRKSTESESDSDFAVGTFDNYNEVEQAEAKVVEVKSKTNDKKAINSRMSPRNLKRVLDSLTTSQQKRLKQMGFGEFAGNFDFDYVPGDTESDDIIQRKELNKKATKKATVKKNQADKKNKQKSTKSESDSDFAVGTFDNYNEVERRKKGKRPVVERDYDFQDAVCAKKKRKGNKLNK